MKLLAHQIWAIRFTVGRWFCYLDMPGALVADNLGIGKKCTSGAVGMMWKLLTKQVVVRFLVSILWGNMCEE